MLAKGFCVRPTGMFRFFAATLLASVLVTTGTAQSVVGATASNRATPVKDSSMLKPPAGAKVAIVEWEDLECPACARAFPIVHAAMNQYKIPLVRHDFLIPGHIWSPKAAVFARYLDDKVSHDLATDYRRQVFASQMRIASENDLDEFTKQFMAAHGKPMPFVVDPTGQLKKEVEADRDLGNRMGLVQTPTLFVVTPNHWTEVMDVMQLYSAIDQAQAEASQGPAKKTVASAKPSAAHR
jgi:protein-disulfide isomerase